MTDAKIFEDLGDSGFNSGVQVVYDDDEDSGELRPEPEETEPKDAVPQKSDDNKVSSDSQALDMDSGVVKDVICDLSECLSEELVLIDIKTETASATKVQPPAMGLPLEFLFQQDDDGDTYVSISK